MKNIIITNGIIFCLVFIVTSLVVADRNQLYFPGCVGNWNCTTTSGNRSIVTFSCSQTTKLTDVYVNLEILLEGITKSLDVVSLELQNCLSVQLNMSLSKQIRLKRLRITHVRLLLFSCEEWNYKHPPDVHIIDVGFIPLIPTGTFGSYDAEDLIFENVRIGQIEKDAISGWARISSLTWNQVHLESISPGAVNVKVHREGWIRIFGSQFPAIRKQVLQVVGGSILVTKSSFIALDDAAFIAKVASFHFTQNEVVGKMGRLDVLTSDLIFNDNHFLGSAGLPFEWGRLAFSADAEPYVMLHMENNDYEHTDVEDLGSHVFEGCVVNEEVLRRNMICNVTLQSSPINAAGSAGEKKECVLEKYTLMSSNCSNSCWKAACQNVGSKTSYSYTITVLWLACRKWR